MRNYFIACLFLLVGPSLSRGCANELLGGLGENPTVIRITRDFGPRLQVDSFPQEALFTRLHALEADSLLPFFDKQNDIAVLYMRLSDPFTAKEILLGLERSNPGKYTVAANLGTAYELLGQLDSALLWINRAVSINPKSHEGSEWIHVMILRYRIAKAKNPHYLAGGSALMLDFGILDLPQNPYDLNTEEVGKELAFQLQERLSFISAPDTLMGMLLFDYANIVSLGENPSEALWYFQAAKDFGFSSDIMTARMSRIGEILAKDPLAKLDAFEGKEIEAESTGMPVYLIAGFIALLAVFGVWMLLRKGKNNR